MSKQQELDGDPLPARRGFPKTRAFLPLNSIPFSPAFLVISPIPSPSTQQKTTLWIWWAQELLGIQGSLIVCRCSSVSWQYLLFRWILSKREARRHWSFSQHDEMVITSPAGGGKPFPKFSHPLWPCLGSGWSWTSTPVPWPLTHSVTWVGRRKKIFFSSPSPTPRTESGIYSGTVRLWLTFLCLLFSLCPTGGMEMAGCCWSEQREMPSLWRAQRGCVCGDEEPEGCLSLCFPGMALGMCPALAVQRYVPGPCRALWGFEVFSKPISDVGIWLEHTRQANRVHLCLLKARSPADWV